MAPFILLIVMLNKKLVNLINLAVDSFLDKAQDIVPQSIREKYRLLTDQEIIQNASS